jgi:PqqD family protein of HPr-rel-A system
VPGQALRRRSWEDETVLYNDLSGDTHLLGLAANEALNALADGPAGLATIAARLGTLFELGDAGAMGDTLATLLDELVQLGIVEAVPDTPFGHTP